MDNGDTVKMFQNHGYTIDGLMKDIRYKVNACLTEAGLAGTSYGKEVLRGIHPVNNYGSHAAL